MAQVHNMKLLLFIGGILVFADTLPSSRGLYFTYYSCIIQCPWIDNASLSPILGVAPIAGTLPGAGVALLPPSQLHFEYCTSLWKPLHRCASHCKLVHHYTSL